MVQKIQSSQTSRQWWTCQEHAVTITAAQHQGNKTLLKAQKNKCWTRKRSHPGAVRFIRHDKVLTREPCSSVHAKHMGESFTALACSWCVCCWRNSVAQSERSRCQDHRRRNQNCQMPIKKTNFFSTRKPQSRIGTSGDTSALDGCLFVFSSKGFSKRMISNCLKRKHKQTSYITAEETTKESRGSKTQTSSTGETKMQECNL